MTIEEIYDETINLLLCHQSGSDWRRSYLVRFRRSPSWTSAMLGMKRTRGTFPPIPRGCSTQNSQRKIKWVVARELRTLVDGARDGFAVPGLREAWTALNSAWTEDS